MKNRKNIVIAFLLVASLCLSVGFAALTDNLTIKGDIKIDVDGSSGGANTAWDNAVVFSNPRDVKVNDITSTAVTPSISGDELIANINAGVLKVKGDNVSFKVDVKNNHAEYDAVISSLANTYNETYFTVEINGIENNTKITKGGTQEVTVKITLIKTPIEAITNESFSISFTATATEPSGT